MLQDRDEEFDEEGGRDGGDAGAGHGALLVEGAVCEGLKVQQDVSAKHDNGGDTDGLTSAGATTSLQK